MRTIQQAVALVICVSLADISIAAEAQAGYTVKYSGGSLPTIKGGEDLRLFIDQDKIRLNKGKAEAVSIPANTFTEISYGQEVHRRIGTAAGLAVVSLGIGALVAFSKSKKHYVGIVWDAGEGKKGGVVLQADKNEYRGLIAGLEGVSGKKAVDTDALTAAAAKSGIAQSVPVPAAAPAVPAASVPSAETAPAQEPPPVILVNTAPVTKVSSQVAPVAVRPPTSGAISPPAAPSQTIPGKLVPAPTVAPTTKATVMVTFASNPPGALVSCGGMQLGRALFAVFLPPGKYSVKYSVDGSPDWEAEILVDPGKSVTFVAQLNSTTVVVVK